jgi:type VI secretion system protein ImpJ
MFILPHHFQVAQRHLLHHVSTTEKWDCHHNWGLRSLILDHDALGNYSFVVRSLRARLRDGTLISVPEDGPLTPLDLHPAFERASPVTVYLAVPVLQAGRANASSNGRAGGSRFYVQTQDLEDENTGVQSRPIHLQFLNFTLLLSTGSLADYEALPIARVQRSAKPNAPPELDLAYIPPVLACDAWQPRQGGKEEGIQAGVLQAVYHRLGKALQEKAQQVADRGITFDGHAAGDGAILARLRAYNEACALLRVLAFVDGLHPLPAYLALCQLVGQLAVFGETGVTPELPAYDHDDLGGCFYKVKMYIDALIDRDQPPSYEEVPFQGVELRMQVALKPEWMGDVYQMFIGVQSPLKPAECIELLTHSDLLDMKIGSAEHVDEIYLRALTGLRFTPTARPPGVLPARQGLVYFQVNREVREEDEQDEWLNVRRWLTLAIRLNEGLAGGTIQGRTAPIRHGGQTIPLQFTLFVLRGEE